MKSWLFAVAYVSFSALALPACLDTGVAPPEAVTSALGQPNGDFPSYDERVVLYATNRARMSPAAETWPAYAPQPPLQWNVDLNHSSRAHSLDMRDTPCFQHPSCGTTTDDTFARVLSFYQGPSRTAGENIAGGPADGITIVHNWIFEIGATAGETGHRDNTFAANFNLLGAGYAPGGMPRPALNNLWTEDFVGTGTALTLPKMTDGIHFPATGAAGGNVTFGTTYFDAAGTAPSRVMVVVDGACSPLTLASLNGMPRGTAGKGAYEAAIALTAGCHAYYFLATAAGTDATYPDTGSLQVSVGAPSAACTLFTTARAASACGGATGSTGTGGAPGTGGVAGGAGTAGSAGAGGAVGSGGAPGAGGAAGAGSPTGVGGGAGNTASGAGGSGGGGPGLGEASGGCACTVPGGPSGSAAGISLVAIALALSVVRRRRVARDRQHR
jgi:MYXO-CTERM domain-containing protein